MKKKMIISIALVAALICLGACWKSTPKPLTLAQTYLNSTSDDDLLNEFEKACYIGTGDSMGFAQVSDISSDDLYLFAIMTADTDTQNKWLSTDQKFHIPLSDVTALLDRYFEGYTFVPNGVQYISGYDDAKKELLAGALGGDMGAWYPVLVSKEAAGDNLIKVVINNKYAVQDDIVITAKVTETGIRFLSCISEKVQFPGGLTMFDDQELTEVKLNMEECNAFFGEPTEVKTSDTGSAIQICTYKDAVCEFALSSAGDGKTGSTMLEMDVTSPDYSPLRGIHIGDSLDSVIAKFPDAGGETDEQSGETVKPLYGDYESGQSFTYGCVISEGTKPVRVEVCNDEWRVKFLIDDHQCVSSIQIISTVKG